jgi:PAS domain S-box-containing protein
VLEKQSSRSTAPQINKRLIPVRFRTGEDMVTENSVAEEIRRQEIEQALRTGEERFRRVVEAAPNAMVMINADGRIEMVNAQAERVFGYPRAEMLGQPVEMLVPERFRQVAGIILDNWLKGRRARDLGLEIRQGGSPKGAERIASCWADHHKVPQIVFKPDWTKHAKAAPFKRNDQLLEALPAGLLAFPGSGISANLADKAKKLGIPVWRFAEGAA